MKRYDFNVLGGKLRHIVTVHAESLDEAVDQVDERLEICSVSVSHGDRFSAYHAMTEDAEEMRADAIADANQLKREGTSR